MHVSFARVQQRIMRRSPGDWPGNSEVISRYSTHAVNSGMEPFRDYLRLQLVLQLSTMQRKPLVRISSPTKTPAVVGGDVAAVSGSNLSVTAVIFEHVRRREGVDGPSQARR